MARALVFLLLLLACDRRPTVEDASRLFAEELTKLPKMRLVLVLDTETQRVYRNGQPFGGAGQCLQLPDGTREITLYLARLETVEQLTETLRHELTHALLSCSNSDHLLDAGAP